MKTRKGKISLAVLVTIAILLLAVNLVTGPATATPINSDGIKLGAFTGPEAGAAQDDNVKASLDLVNTDTAAIIVDGTQAATAATLVGYKCVSVDVASIATVTDLFQVTGGPVIIRDIVGVVTGTIVATGCLINYNIDPIAPATDTVFGTDGTAMEINADAIGTVYTWDGVIATDLTPTTNGVVLTQGTDVANGLLCPIGMIELAATATNAGTVTFYMTYSPLSPLSVVTAQ